MRSFVARGLIRSLLALAVLAGSLLLPVAAVNDEALERFLAFARQEMEAQKVPGMTVGFRHREATWVEGFGFSDLENEVPAGPESAYRLASVTKTMTAVAVLKLVELGKIDLDAEVQTYVPYFPRKEHPVAVRQLLGHLGGISHYRNYDEEGHFKDHKNTRESIAVFEEFDLVAEPGTLYNYSSYGYNLLGAIIEGASQESYGEFLNESIWKPLGMDSTRMDDPDALIPHRVRGYRLTPGGKVINSEFVNISSRFAAGGTRSTVPDLLRFTKGLRPGGVLSAETLDGMWTSMVTADGQPTGYAMGWAVTPLNGRFGVGHGGGQAETRTFLLFLPREDLTIAIAMNFEGGDRMPFVRRLAEAVLGESIVPRLYAGGRELNTVYSALDRIFDEGSSYHDRYGRAMTEDPERLKAAFAFINSHFAMKAVDRDADAASEALERGLNTEQGSPFAVAGSFVAQQLAARLEPDEFRAVRAGGPLPFFARYVELAKKKPAVPKSLRLERGLGETIATWNRDWERIWNDRTQAVVMSTGADLDTVLPLLQEEFKDASIYPNYWGRMENMLETFYTTGQPLQAAKVAEAGRSLYPELGGPHFYSGVLSMAFGDLDAAKEGIDRARELDPSGNASAGSLNRWAYNFKSIGMLDAGLTLLGIAREMYPDNANLCDSTGEFYLDKGDTERAIAFYEKALEIDPDFENAKKMLQKIRERSAD